LIACSLFVSNLFYLTPFADPSTLPGRVFQHTWSLGVEEQFYLLWPLLIGLVPLKRLPAALLAVGIGAIVFRCLVVFGLPMIPHALPPGDRGALAPFAVLYSMPFNYRDAFAMGAGMNFIRWSPKPWHVYCLGAFTLFAGIASSGVGTMTFNGKTVYWVLGYPIFMMAHDQAIWGYTLIAMNAGVLLLAIVNGDHFRRLTLHPFARWWGKRAYAAYLYHVLILMLLRPLRNQLGDWMGSDALSGIAILPLAFVILALACHFSYADIEKPLLTYRDRLIPRWAQAKRPPTSQLPGTTETINWFVEGVDGAVPK
jgi:peptidoglycan/LPS O-acetylase OafA/YrhL